MVTSHDDISEKNNMKTDHPKYLRRRGKVMKIQPYEIRFEQTDKLLTSLRIIK